MELPHALADGRITHVEDVLTDVFGVVVHQNHWVMIIRLIRYRPHLWPSLHLLLQILILEAQFRALGIRHDA